mmetsp:Transcript_1518/g.2713  ORF Transcript_1518/g.2713 Transcript_1518/m.2713 type:complete len:162 (-) Transcript_1518:93-578(-)
MAKHRSLRKSRNRQVTHRKPKDVNKRKFLDPRRIQDEALRSRYDKKKTLKQNLEATDVKEMFASKLPDSIPKEAKHQVKVNEDEAPICRRLAQKHGENYEAMHWDIKLNELQWTKRMCEKKVGAWRQGKTRSMCAEILSGHGQDMRKPIFGAAGKRNVFGH